MQVLWGPEESSDQWGNGKVFKPATGDSFTAKSIQLIEDGSKLEVIGCKLMFCKHPVWVRVQ